jgi:hypothetical protein
MKRSRLLSTEISINEVLVSPRATRKSQIPTVSWRTSSEPSTPLDPAVTPEN